MFYVTHEDGQLVATDAPAGKLMGPAYVSTDFRQAKAFDTWAAASDASQNFGQEWSVEDMSGDAWWDGENWNAY